MAELAKKVIREVRAIECPETGAFRVWIEVGDGSMDAVIDTYMEDALLDLVFYFDNMAPSPWRGTKENAASLTPTTTTGGDPQW